jgi:hypothetical protein
MHHVRSSDLSLSRRFVCSSSTTLSRFEQTMLDLLAETFDQRVVSVLLHTLSKEHL